MGRLMVRWLLASFITLPIFAQDDTTGVELLALGDVNLGRSVGQRILGGDTLYAFRDVLEVLRAADLVFVNLESQVTEQGGQTVHPKNNLIFCAPPAAADALRQAGIDVVSTANNHAFDYGRRGLRETVEHLDRAGIAWTGTSPDSVAEFPPTIVERDSIRIGFVAFTETVNLRGRWKGRIAVFDSLLAAQSIRSLRDRVDIVVASYHGGREYGGQPGRATRSHLRWLAESGADIVLGHHPHVPYGIERWNDAWLLPSLGNFVFGQPQHFWTQIGLAARFRFMRNAGSVSIAEVVLIPFRAAMQPRWELPESERDSVWNRITNGSTLHYRRTHERIHVTTDATP